MIFTLDDFYYARFFMIFVFLLFIFALFIIYFTSSETGVVIGPSRQRFHSV